MATVNVAYGSSTALTLSLASLATSSTLLVGRESTAVDNTGTLAIDYLVGGKVTTGTSPTGGVIEIWAVGSYDGTTYVAGATGSDAGLTLTQPEKVQLRLLAVIDCDTTSNHTYEWGVCSIAAAFGGIVPKKWSLFVVHSSGVNLNSTAGNHEAKYTAVTLTVA